MKSHNYATLKVLAVLFLFLGCRSNSGGENAAHNRELILEYHEVWNTGELEKLNEILAPDFVCHYLTDIKWKGIAAAKTEIGNWKKLFPDWQEEIVDIVQENDKVVTRYKATATHTRTYEGIDATGAKIAIYEVSIYRIQDGKIAEQWCFPDDPSIKTQILDFEEEQNNL